MSEGFSCSLPAGDLAARAGDLRDLMAAALVAVERPDGEGGRALRLSFAPAAEADVREAVRREEQCCAFLGFDVRVAPGAVVVDVTAPEGGQATLDALAGLAGLAAPTGR